MRKKFVRTLLSALLVCALLVMPAFAESATVTTDDVNMREGPGTEYRVLECLPLGAVVNVTDPSGSWYGVEYQGLSGYVAAQFLQLQEDRVTSSTAAEEGVVNTDGVRFRSTADSRSAILAELDAGTPVTVTGSAEGGWLACTVDGQAGYIYADYVTTGQTVSTTRAEGRTLSASVSAYPTAIEVGGSAYVVVEDGGFSPSSEGPSGAEAPWDEEVSVPASTPAPTRTQAESSDPTGSDKPTSTRGGSSVESNISSVTDEGVSTYPSPAPGSSSPASTGGDGKSGYINGNYVRFRSGPSTSSSILGTYDYGTRLTVLGASGDWTYCRIDNMDGYVYSSYVTIIQSSGSDSNVTVDDEPVLDDVEIPSNYRSTVQRTRVNSVSSNVEINPAKVPAYWPGSTATQVSVDPTIAYINANSVRFRSAPSMSSGILGELSFGNTVTITGTVGEWTAITYKGTAGYVYSSYVTKGQYQSNSVGGTVKGREIADYALQYVGYSYVWGGTSPSTGFDCSGLVYYVYKHFGYTLNRVAADQAKNGVHVDPSNLQPGDILCFYSGGSYIGHVGIYIGNNRFVHAQNSATGVVTTELAGYYASRGYEARRII